MPQSTASTYVLENIGHHIIKWAMHRICAGTMTPEQFGQQHAPTVRQGDTRATTIANGIRELIRTPPQDLPITLR